MKENFNINFGRDVISLEVSKDLLKHKLRPADVDTVNEVTAEVERALKNPIGTKSLDKLVRRGDKVAILADDITRLTPTEKIIPQVLNVLNRGGVPDKDITLVIALGTHRPMTTEECLQKYGQEVIDRVGIVNPNYLDENSLKHYGVTRRGTDIWVNRLVVEADVRIGIGNIVPHHPTGWSGGAKILLPGVAGEKTTGQFHLLGATEQLLGQIETPCREEMEDFAKAIGFDFIINTILDRDGMLVKIVAGHFIEAHRAGVKCGEGVFGALFKEQTDITLSSTYPVDFDLFQADKGVFSAAISTKPGGEIILLSPCNEGVSPTHPEVIDIAHLPDEELFRMAREGFDEHDSLSIAEALYFNSAKRMYKVTLVSSGVSKEIAEKMGLNYVELDDLQNYIDSRLKGGSSIGVVHNSAETLPIQQDRIIKI